MKTHFAPPERAKTDVLKMDISAIVNNPVVDTLMQINSGLLAVLNEHRQILALNKEYLSFLGVSDPEKVLGMRPGEAVKCVHAHDMPGGCGTSEYCPTCGAVIAVMSALIDNKPTEQNCVLEFEQDGKIQEMYLRVSSQPLEFNNKRYLLLFLQDITSEQLWANIERVFYHDVNNLLTTIVCQSQNLLMDITDPDLVENKLIRNISESSSLLAREIGIHQSLTGKDKTILKPLWEKVKTEDVIHELGRICRAHPSCKNKTLRMPEPLPVVIFKTDPLLLVRVLTNMTINALEASEEQDEVKIHVNHKNDALEFSVWNRQPISPDIAKRVFQRNFSTKEGAGRGLGTYSMKLLGEDFLGGKVDFESSEAQGTVFSFSVNAAHTD